MGICILSFQDSTLDLYYQLSTYWTSLWSHLFHIWLMITTERENQVWHLGAYSPNTHHHEDTSVRMVAHAETSTDLPLYHNPFHSFISPIKSHQPHISSFSHQDFSAGSPWQQECDCHLRRDTVFLGIWLFDNQHFIALELFWIVSTLVKPRVLPAETDGVVKKIWSADIATCRLWLTVETYPLQISWV